MQVTQNENNHYRGLHVVILDPLNGEIKSRQVFDTYKSSEKFDWFISNEVKPDDIVVAACMDECTKNLS